MTSDYFGFDPDSDEVINREDIPHAAPATDRSRARRVALQWLYEIDSAERSVGVVLNAHLKFSDARQSVLDYATYLVRGVYRQTEKLDTLLQTHAPEWPIQQIAVIDRNILRIGVFELLVDGTVPLAVVIDEAIELAKLYGADNSPRFINGVLGAIADNIDKIQLDIDTPDNDLPDDIE
jgi:N utilization substance protein B